MLTAYAKAMIAIELRLVLSRFTIFFSWGCTVGREELSCLRVRVHSRIDRY